MATFNGTPDADTYNGTPQGDTINGQGGDDTLNGRDGDDTINGGDGRDTIIGGFGKDTINGGDGADTITDVDGDDAIDGGNGDDSISGGSGFDFITGGDGNDTIYGGYGKDTVDGGAGNDLIYGGEGTDLETNDYNVLSGGEGSDYVYGTGSLYSSDRYVDDAGLERDRLHGTGSFNVGIGDDITAVGPYDYARLSLLGSPVGMTVDVTGFNSTRWDVFGATWLGVEGLTHIIGSNGNDTFIAGNPTPNMYIQGGEGDDKLELTLDPNGPINGARVEFQGGAGNDTVLFGEFRNHAVYGGIGIDTLDLRRLGSGAGLHLISGTGTGSAPALFNNFEIILGTEFDDTISGAGTDTLLYTDIAFNGYGGNDQLTGGEGNDLLDGGDGNNTLIGGGGNDILTGGAGFNIFAGGAGVDTVVLAGAAAGVSMIMHPDALRVTFSAGEIESVENVDATVHDDMIAGSNQSNILRGMAGNDMLSGLGSTDTLDGGDGDDTLDGGDGNDVLDGGAGNDRLIGGTGIDIYRGGTGIDTAVLSGSAAGVTLTLQNSGMTTFSGGEMQDVENIEGTGFDDTITGNSSANVLRGMDGSDTMAGMAGADMIDGGNGNDTIEGGDDNDTLTGGAGSDTISGNGGDDTIYGYLNATQFSQPGVNDAMYGGAGADTIYGVGVLASAGRGNGNAGADDAGLEKDVLVGGGSFYVGIGDDVTGRVGVSDTVTRFSLLGATAGVTLDLTGFNSTEWNVLGGVWRNVDAIGTIIGTGEDDTFIGGNLPFVMMLDAGAGDDRLDLTSSLPGGGGRIIFQGGTGNDTVIYGGNSGHFVGGGDGVDTLDLRNATVGANMNLRLGSGSGSAPASFGDFEIILGTTYDDVISNGGFAIPTFEDVFLYGYDGNDELTGGDGNDVLDGGSGHDRLYGNGGDDTLIGGTGINLYDGGDGIDTVVLAGRSTGIYLILGSGRSPSPYFPAGDEFISVENVDATAFDDIIYGDGNANVIRGMGGNDGIYAGGGDDRVEGGDGNDTVDGGSGNDMIIGGAGDDRIDGGTGIDKMDGGTGDDWFNVDSGADVVIERVGEGNDRVFSTVSYTLAAGVSIEVLAAQDQTTTTAMSLTGNEFGQAVIGNDGANQLSGAGGNDILFGNGGNDYLDGGSGIDTMVGGTGNDTYAADSSSDSAIEAVGEGYDRLLTTIDYRLTTGSEIELLSAADQAGTTTMTLIGNDFGQGIIGNEGANDITGMGGNDTLYGLGGNDALDGGTGFDTLIGGTGNDAYAIGDLDAIVELAGEGYDRVLASIDYQLSAAAEIELLSATDQNGVTALNLAGNDFGQAVMGNEGANTLSGLGGNDTLYGFGGNDRLNGGAGVDTLYGGLGDDVFVFDAVTHSTSTGFDRIDLATGDKIDLNVTVTSVATTVASGSLSGVTFDSDLTTAIGAGQLGAGQAVLFNPNSGSLAGTSFLIIDANGVAGYQAGEDYVIGLVNPMSTLPPDPFV